MKPKIEKIDGERVKITTYIEVVTYKTIAQLHEDERNFLAKLKEVQDTKQAVADLGVQLVEASDTEEVLEGPENIKL